MNTRHLRFAATALLICIALPATVSAQQKKAPRKPAPVYVPPPVVGDAEGKKTEPAQAPAPRPPVAAAPGKKVTPPVKPAPLKFATPDAVARRMFDSWRQGNRTAASYVATSAALNDLFTSEARPMDAQPCEWTGQEYQCLYMDQQDEMLDFSINVKPHSKLGFLVTSISFREDD